MLQQKMPRRVLIANDSKVQRETLKLYLAGAGFEVTVAVDGKQALESIESDPPDLVLSDMVMPFISGAALCRFLKSNPVTADIPILLLTALRYDDAGVTEGLEAGADDYLELDSPSTLILRKAKRLIAQADAVRAAKETKRLLEESERRLRVLVDSAHDIICLVNTSGAIEYASGATERVLGYKAAELKGKDAVEFVHPDDRPRINEIFENVLQGQTAATEHRCLAADGGWRWLETTAVNMIHDEAVAGVILNSRDIADRKETVESLRQAVDMKEAIFQGSRDGIFISDANSRFVVVNRAACELTGYTETELLTMSIPDLHEDVDLEAFRNYHQRIMEGDEVISEAKVRRKDGTKLDAEFNNRRVCISGKQFMHTVARDITERRNAEERLMQFAAKLQESNRDLEEFAYVASHDLQEPLRKIQTFAGRLASKLIDQGDSKDYLGRIQNAAHRMQTLITDLLVLSRVTTGGRPFKTLDLAAVVGEVVSDLEVQIEQAGASIEIGYLPIIDADGTQMRQLFQNLIANSLKFRRSGVDPIVRVWDDLLHKFDNGIGLKNDQRQICQIIVEDNGIGFNPEYADRIFAPFQRLHGRSEFEGTGIGLAVCRKIVERHGGKLSVESESGKGTRFIIALPTKQYSIAEPS